MANTGVEQRISLFHSLVKNRRFDDETVRVLELLLVSKDVKSLVEVRSSLIEFMQSESVIVVREIVDKTVEQKLLVLEFLVRVFARIGDIESCLALRYEALVLRDLKSASCKGLKVSQTEWLDFAEQLLENGFYATAVQACENAQECLQMTDVTDPKSDENFEQLTKKIKILKYRAIRLEASHSVQAQTAEYLRKKTMKMSSVRPLYSREKQCAASTLFINGIKKRNAKKFHELQGCSRLP